MNRRTIVMLAALAALPSALAQDVDRHQLRYRFDTLAGKTAVYTVETELRQAVDHTGEPGAEGLRWRRDTLEQRYERRGLDGRVRQKSTRVEIRIEQQDQEPIRYDSRKGGAIPKGLEGLVEKVGKSVVIELSQQGVVSRVRGAESAAERRAYEAAFLEWPRDPIAVGDRWSKLPLQRVPYPPFGTLVYATKYKLEDRGENGRSALSAETTVLFEPTDEVKPDSPVVSISKQAAGGTLVFDADGLLLESRFNSELQVTITSGDVVRVERASSQTAQRLRSIE